MKRYKPNIAINPEQATTPELARFLIEQLREISASFESVGQGRADVLSAAPQKYRDGQYVYADGVTWNPGFGKGWYYSNGSGWLPIMQNGVVSLQPTGELRIGPVAASRVALWNANSTVKWEILNGFTSDTDGLFTIYNRNLGFREFSIDQSGVVVIGHTYGAVGELDFSNPGGTISKRIAFGTDNSGKSLALAKNVGGVLTDLVNLYDTGVLDLLFGQVKFPATQNASSDANTLDDYERGTWTPTIKGSSTAGTQTYSNQTGKYTKIGNVVIATFRITMTAKDAATAGAVRLGGLPFTVVGSLGGQAFAFFANFDLSAGYSFLGYLGEASTTDISLIQSGDNVALSLPVAAAITATTDFCGTLVYTI